MRFLSFLSLLATRPSEACGRVEGILDSHLEPLWVRARRYQPSHPDVIRVAAEETLGVQFGPFLQEAACHEIEAGVTETMGRISDDAPFPRFLNGDLSLGRLCYALTRALQAETVVETGVCYGVTSAFILQALNENGRGRLYSIDLPPLGKDADAYVGALVPENLRSRWKVIRGTSRRRLSGLLRQIGKVDLFVHDSLHTCRNMRRELLTVTPYLSRPAIVVSDDVDRNPAFQEWVEYAQPRYSAVLKQESKASLLGLAFFPGVHSSLGVRRHRPTSTYVAS